MRATSLPRWLVALALTVGCGGRETARDASSTDTASTDTASTDTASADAASTDAATDGPRADAVTSDGGAAPNISVALDCGRGSAVAGPGPAAPDSMQRMDIDTATFPDAICNDGTAAAIFFRPFRGETNRHRWLINLRGGGGCGDGQSCAARWCGCTGGTVCPATPATSYTNFDRDNMTSTGPASQNGTGIFLRGDAARPNVLGDYNQVRVIYCSSDGWAGTRRGVTLTAVHPVTGAPVTYTAHFLGSRILDAVLATLRHDGARGPAFTLDRSNTALPDLDEAVEVVFAGDSAGGTGVVNNLDRVSATLRSHNTACASGGACPLAVRGLIDAAVGPDKSRLTLSPTGRLAMAGASTYAGVVNATAMRREAIQGARVDESCTAWHRANMPGTEAQCYDESHVVRHHITTPFFVRMALRDNLVSGNYYDDGWIDPTLGPFDRTATVFARVLQSELTAFPRMNMTAEERAEFTRPPGVFAPLCTNHDTINEDSEVYGVTITPSAGRATRLLDVFDAWRNGTSPAAVLSDPGANMTVCP